MSDQPLGLLAAQQKLHPSVQLVSVHYHHVEIVRHRDEVIGLILVTIEGAMSIKETKEEITITTDPETEISETIET